MQRAQYYPFYMNCREPGFWEDGRFQEREDRLMRALYPRTAQKIWRQVEEACDRYDYPGSFLYDEYPDKYMVEQICRRILEKGALKCRDEGLLGEMIQVLLCQEMHRRRCLCGRRRHF